MTPTNDGGEPAPDDEGPAPPASDAQGPSQVSVPRRILHLEPGDSHFRGDHKLTLAQIEYWSLTKGHPCWASDAQLADAIGVSESSVERYVKKLAARGYIAIWDAGQPSRVLEPLRPDWRADWRDELSTPWKNDWQEGLQPPNRTDRGTNGDARPSTNGGARSSPNDEARSSVNGGTVKQRGKQSRKTEVKPSAAGPTGAGGRARARSPAQESSSEDNVSVSSPSDQLAPETGRGTDAPREEEGSGDPPSLEELENGSDRSLRYPPQFEELWSAYPERDLQSSKRGMYRIWRTRISSGEPPERMLQGVRAYAQFLRRADWIGTKLVKHADRFLAERHYLNKWKCEEDEELRRAEIRDALEVA